MLELQQLLTDERMLLEKRLLAWGGHIFPYTSKYLLSFGVLGMLLGSKYLLRRCLDVYGLVVFSPRSLDSFDIQHLSKKMLSCAFDAKLLNKWSRTGVDVRRGNWLCSPLPRLFEQNWNHPLVSTRINCIGACTHYGVFLIVKNWCLLYTSITQLWTVGGDRAKTYSGFPDQSLNM